ncbi:MAG TPA: mechanosensitive ion channel family protein [Telluria sp.]|jgi:small-conductance mechanosensitive channel
MRFPFPSSTLIDWASGVAVAVIAALLLFGLQRFLIHRLDRRARHTATSIDDWLLQVLRSTYSLFLALISLYIGSLTLALSDQHALLLRRLAITVVLVQAAVWGDVAVRAWRARYRAHAGAAESTVGVLSTAILDFLLRLAVWLIVALMILDNLGFNITTLVASLGIGGIAVALAVQNVLGDLFASLSIVLDKPFVVGDFIIVDDILGTVEYIGLKTTRLRSLGGEQVIFSNGDLLKARIRNHQRMQTRRAAFIIRVSYATTGEQLRAIPEIARSIVTAQSGVNFERAHFSALSESSLDFEVVYWILTADYLVFMDAQQAIYLALVRQLRELGIEFAQPLRKVQLHGSLQTAWRTQ